MRQELVKKIDNKFLDHGTREEFRLVILEFLNGYHEFAARIAALEKRNLELENEIRILKGEKKSPNSSPTRR
jgi:hypothetical protein